MSLSFAKAFTLNAFLRKWKFTFILLVSASCTHLATAQVKDSIIAIELVKITGYKTMNGVGHMLDLKDGIIYAGKKNEVLVIDSLDANKAINNTRQILGRIPGLNIVETESGGFTANGIATRGLNPTQSSEMNTRQNGYNISGDIYGYNESYYLPPMEAVSRIEMLRGAASLQFGSQFGGLVNYVIKEAPKNKKFELYTSQTMGNYGLYNGFLSAGGTVGKVSYYGYLQHRTFSGYRPNSEQWQLSGFGKIAYQINDKLQVGVEYSLLRNQIHMPGGLTDSLFAVSNKISSRARNWLKSPWNVTTGFLNYAITQNAALHLKTTYLSGGRSIVWRNEDGGPEAIDGIDSNTLEFSNREVGIQKMQNSTTELRFSQNYVLGKFASTLAGGLRFSYAWFNRKGGGEGSTNSDFDLSIKGNWGYDLDFTTTNFAPFIENIFRLGEKLTVTPGFRFEYFTSTSKGYKVEDNEKLVANEKRSRQFPLLGTGIEYKPNATSSIYANYSQAYRPIDYSQLTPFGITSVIDPKMKDSKGFNSDLGYRATVKNLINVDVSAFYMQYNNRIGVVLRTDPISGNPYSLRTNIANSIHKGIESYIEWNLLKTIQPKSKNNLSIFNSFAYIDARYVSGEYKGNRVEAAAKTINRTGIVCNIRNVSATVQMNMVGDAYGDASNARSSSDPVAGYIPAYTVYDASATWKVKTYSIKFGINNLSNAKYFTRRTDEYPGPGIIPSIGRSFYIGFATTL